MKNTSEAGFSQSGRIGGRPSLTERIDAALEEVRRLRGIVEARRAGIEALIAAIKGAE